MGHEVLGKHTQRQCDVVRCLGTGGVARANGDESEAGVLAGQVGHPEGPEVLHLPVGQIGVRFTVVEKAAVDDTGELVGGV